MYKMQNHIVFNCIIPNTGDQQNWQHSPIKKGNTEVTEDNSCVTIVQKLTLVSSEQFRTKLMHLFLSTKSKCV